MKKPPLSSAGRENNRAWQATLEGRYEEALEAWDALLAWDQQAAHYNNRGITHLLAGNLRAAWRDFVAARNEVPYHANEKVGVALWLLDRRAEACADWAKEIEAPRYYPGERALIFDGGNAPLLL